MNESIYLYKTGCSGIMNDRWWIDKSKVVNRIYYVKNGSAVVSYGKKEYTLRRGYVYILPATEDFASVSAENFEHIFFDYYNSRALKFDSFTEIPAAFCDLFRLFEFVESGIRNKSIDEETGAYLLNAVLAIIERNMQLPYVNNEILENALNIIRSEIFGITTKELARRLNLNECYFIQLFKRNIGMSPMKYIRSLRLDEGKRLLKSGKSINFVSEYCGYNNSGAFWKAVRREYGCTPTELRKR